MTLALTITDNADGTGAIATISGSAGASNVVSLQAVNGQLGLGAWIPFGGRTGDGTVPLSIATGYYWARLDSTAGGIDSIAPLVYFAATSGVDAVQWRCKTAAQALIQTMMLPGVQNQSVAILKQPWPRDFGSDIAGKLPLPGIILADWGSEQMNFAAGTNVRDDVGYPVIAAIVAADNQDLTANLPLYNRWRWRIAKAFRNQALAGVPEIYTCHIEPMRIAPPDAFLAGYYLSALLLRFISREPRGIAP